MLGSGPNPLPLPKWEGAVRAPLSPPRLAWPGMLAALAALAGRNMLRPYAARGRRLGRACWTAGDPEGRPYGCSLRPYGTTGRRRGKTHFGPHYS